MVAWIVAILAGIALLVFLSPLFLYGGHGYSKRSSDLSNVKQIAVGHALYMYDSDGYGPPPEQRMDVLLPDTKTEKIYTSPGLDADAGEYGYAYLRELGGIRLDDVLYPAKVPLLFNSSDLQRNVAGGLDLLPDPSRWEGGNNIAFLDTHAKRHEIAPKFMIEPQ